MKAPVIASALFSVAMVAANMSAHADDHRPEHTFVDELGPPERLGEVGADCGQMLDLFA